MFIRTIPYAFQPPLHSEPSYLLSVGLSVLLVRTTRCVTFIPWILKVVFALVSDRYNLSGWGWRRPFVLLGVLLEAACFLLLTCFSPKEYFVLYLLVTMLRNCAIALADGGADGLSVDAGIEESSGALQSWCSECEAILYHTPMLHCCFVFRLVRSVGPYARGGHGRACSGSHSCI